MFANVALPLKLSTEEISSLFGEIVSKKHGFGWYTYDEFSKRVVDEIKDAGDIQRIVTELLKSNDAEKLDTLIEYIEHLSQNPSITLKDEWVYTDKSGTPDGNSYNAVLQLLLAFTFPQHYTPNAPQMEEVTLNDFLLRDYWLDGFSPLKMYLAIDDSVGEIDRLFEWAKDQKPDSSKIRHTRYSTLCDSSACDGGCWCCESIIRAVLSKSDGSMFFGSKTIDWLMREDADDFDEEENDSDCICDQRVNTLMNVLERVVVISKKIYLSTRHRMISDCIKEVNRDNLPLEIDLPQDGGDSLNNLFKAMTEQLASKYEGVKPDYTVIVKNEDEDDSDGDGKKCEDDDDSDKKCEDDGSPKSKRVCV